MTDAYSLPIGSTLAGKYKILRVLGAGGMGSVYLAENIAIGRQVAIKVLHAKLGEDPSVRTRFRQEARTSALIGHPGIVDVLDLGETERGEAFIVMERLDGQTLGARLKQRGRLSVEEAVAVITEALDAIGAAHAKGIIHRDLKPDNLFLVWTPKWCVKILDFGISKFLNSDDVRLTASNTLMGSVLYMPPEQARDARVAGPTADLYALGATLYHALGGTPPFLGENYTEVLSRVISDHPQPLDRLRNDLPATLVELVAKLLAKKPADRPQSAAEVKAALLATVERIVPPEPPKIAPDALLDTRPAGSADAALAATGALGETGAALGATQVSHESRDGALAPTQAPDALGATQASEPGRPSPTIDRPGRGPALLNTSAVAGQVSPVAPTTPRRWLRLGAAAAIAAGITVAVVVPLTRSSTETTSDAASAADAEFPQPLAPDAPLIDALVDPDASVITSPDAPRVPVDSGATKRTTPLLRPDAGLRSEAGKDSGSYEPLEVQPIPRP